MFFFLCNIGQENVFYNILERKSAFLGYKNSVFKRWKKGDFCKGVNPWFWSKIGHYSIFFFFRHHRPGKCLLRYSRTIKTPFQAIKAASSNSGKKCDVCRGVNPWFWFKIGHFSIFCFQAIQGRKMCFTIFQNEKTFFRV